MFVICSLVAGHRCAAHAAKVSYNLHRVTDGNRHKATMPPVFVHLSSISNSRGESALSRGQLPF